MFNYNKLGTVCIGTDITNHKHVLDNDKRRSLIIGIRHGNRNGINKIFQPSTIFCPLIRKSIIARDILYNLETNDFDLSLHKYAVYH